MENVAFPMPFTPLTCPVGCSESFLEVAGTERQWQNGSMLAFDDSCDHSARHDGEEASGNGIKALVFIVIASISLLLQLSLLMFITITIYSYSYCFYCYSYLCLFEWKGGLKATC